MLQIDCQNLTEIKSFSWKHSKVLSQGSLVIFSFDNFKTFGTGIIEKTDFGKMDQSMRSRRKCEISIQVVNHEKTCIESFDYFEGKSLVVLDSRFNFQEFRHILKTLQGMKNMPFTDIIHGKSNALPKLPKFLNVLVRTGRYWDESIQSLDNVVKE